MSPQGCFFWFLRNLDFVQPSHGFAWFWKFGRVLKLAKIDKKTCLENILRKNTVFFFLMWKNDENWTPFSRRETHFFLTFSALALRGAQREPQGRPREAKRHKKLRFLSPKHRFLSPKGTKRSDFWGQARWRNGAKRLWIYIYIYIYIYNYSVIWILIILNIHRSIDRSKK